MSTRMVFRVGDLVSCGKTVGRVIQLRRKKDNQPFLMVEIETGPQRGKREWPDGGWELGVGSEQSLCGQCARPFHYQPGDDAVLCATCAREEANASALRSADPERHRTSWERKQRQQSADVERAQTFLNRRSSNG
jgi:LSD1 subclass zinc finger protein